MKKIVSLFLAFLFLNSTVPFTFTAREMSGQRILYDFEDGTAQGWRANSPEALSIEVRDLGDSNKALYIDYHFQDKTDQTWWDAVCIRRDGKEDLSGYQAVSFDVTLNLSAIDGYGSISGIGAAIQENWGNFVMFDKFSVARPQSGSIGDELVTVHCRSRITEEMAVTEQLLIYLVGGAVDYNGPLYIDNIGLVSEMNQTQDSQAIVWTKQTPVQKNGRLQVIGTNLCNEQGEPVQLQGMSYAMVLRYPELANRAVFQALAYDWRCDIVRLSIDLGEDEYTGTQEQKDLIYRCIDYAIETGMYVLLDWHVLGYGDPLDVNNGNPDAFFDEFSAHYKDVPNIIYELCNEPNGANVTWEKNIKPYAERLIPVIRNNDPDSVIVVGTGTWSQDVDKAALSPLTYPNILYTVHFYAKTHKQSLRDKVSKAISKGLAVFATEWGMTTHTGADGVDVEETEIWLDFMKENNISWTNWSLNRGSSESSVLLSLIPDGNQNGLQVMRPVSDIPEETAVEGYRYWPEEQLSFCGQYVRNIIRQSHPDQEADISLEIASVTVENGIVSVLTEGGTGANSYSYYLLKDGKVYASHAYLSGNTCEIDMPDAGEYRLRVYVQDSTGRRVAHENIIVI